MTELISQSLLSRGFPLMEETGQRQKAWDFSNQGYYDLTPPGEISEAEDLYDIPSGVIDSETEPLVAVIGVGYVGEHLVGEFSKHYDVLGYDVSEARVKMLSDKFADNSRLRLTHSAKDIASATHFLISVPTLLLPDKTIDSSYLRSALAAVGLHARRGATVVIESSVAVGMTRELLGPLAKERGFFAGMSPERVDPGRFEPPAHAIPKVVSGLDDVVPGSLDAILRLYSQAFDRVVPVSRPEVAEMMKLYENCQRMVCIAYANEMADACLSHDIDPYEVCRAAATKPFGYMPYSPGLGVGGHCIPVNPYYLLSNSQFPLLEAASEKMRARPAAIAQRAVDQLYRERRDGLRPRVLVAGIGFKVGQSHLANSPGLELAKALVLTDKVEVSWVDPLVTQEAVPQIPRLDVEDWNVESLQHHYDMVIVAFRQHGLDFSVLDKLQGVKVEKWCP
ncbi:UDP-N-acetyl-D-glucosamine 6-dehydrogenase [Paramyrothecium foliicola]|nr:UDP-N-acetyl-D-glucosamine 6-dehydrogenase [Paramyrothecium foliicola]